MSKYIQLQFPFMRDICLQCYSLSEIKYMKNIYESHFKDEGLSQNEFLLEVYIPIFADIWEKNNREKYFEGLEDIL